jgi:aspartyl protease
MTMSMTNTKKIVGDIGIGGLGYINAIVMSRHNRVYSPIRFCVDTGCSVTIISRLDALRIGLDYSNNRSLQKSDQQTINGVRAFIPYILSGAEILFNSEGTSIVEYVGNIHVMPPPPPTTNTNRANDESNQISLLGVDVLKKFTISFSQDNIILGK